MDRIWHEDPETREGMGIIGLVELEPGRWGSTDGMKEITDFDGGVVILTRIVAGRPEFDVSTVHRGDVRDSRFLNECFGVHAAEIRRRTADLLQRGMVSVEGRGVKS